MTVWIWEWVAGKVDIPWFSELRSFVLGSSVSFWISVLFGVADTLETWGGSGDLADKLGLLPSTALFPGWAAPIHLLSAIAFIHVGLDDGLIIIFVEKH